MAIFLHLLAILKVISSSSMVSAVVPSPPPPQGDTVSAGARTRIMKSVRQKDTGAEMAVRCALHALGVRFRVRNSNLPGSPDIANRKRRWAIFVNGCFWHGHKNCSKTKSKATPRVPVSNPSYWGPKLVENRRRDARKCLEMRHLGFRVLIVWECELADTATLLSRLTRFVEF
jgi:DNA mismatch endonuclease (patch repair protein)